MAYQEFEQDSSKLLLDAVNVLLQMIGEPPVTEDEDYNDIIEANIALSVINETKREILSDGWDINTDTGYTFPVSDDGKIPVPFNVLSLSSADGDLIIRSWSLYSKSRRSQNFTEAQTVDVIWDIPFNEITHALRNYITISAARKFQARQVMDKLVYAYSDTDEGRARVIAKREDGRTSKPNLYTSQFGQQYLVGGL
jgi:hypothetical protein